MERSTRLVVGMADQCREVLQAERPDAADLPRELRPAHLLWMCDKIRDNAAEWPSTKLHRWIGFVQGAMIANRLLDLAAAKSMFDSVKAAHGDASDQDLIDHLDPTSSFQMDLGGQG